MPRSRYRFVGDDAPYFMTMTVNHWLPVFTRSDTVEILLDSWRWLQQHEGLRLHGYVILENHLHLVAGAPGLPGLMRRFKSHTARQIIDLLQAARVQTLLDLLALFKRRHKADATYQLWEEGSHPKRIESEMVMRQKLDYIHHNPVKRGYVDLPEHWRWSSARNYAGEPGVIEIDKGW
ncbi:transposase [uncultured Thiohalocapsa sp.]|uniref:REP-associated tyrosine transposase n=1 Tax=uncultured Thiohalocapsa sp. TaxID=768990 RepID=UPI0025EB2A65|nr:transposase [uncultured Thiohalocapsa sp.]